MGTILRQALTRLWGAVLCWGLGLFLLGWPIVSVYDVVKREQEKIIEVARNFELVIAGMGGNLDDLTNPASYLSLRYFSFMPLILGFYAVLGGSGLLAADEENGTLELVLAHPVSRTALFVGRWLANACALVAILAAAWVGLRVPMARTSLVVGAGALARPFLSLLAELLLFGNLALVLSMVLPSRRLAAMTAGMALVASFFLTMLARIDRDLELFARLSPLQYYQGGEAIEGLNGAWLGGLLAVAGLLAVLAWYCFERRDIRVGGEGVWRWPWSRAADRRCRWAWATSSTLTTHCTRT
jgi:ABC-2 type transport system permease protein